MSRSALTTPQPLRQLWYPPLLALAMALMLLRLLLMARLLDINAFASYSAGLLVSSSFCMLVCLGLQPMLQRELPVAIVRGTERRGAILTAQCVIAAIGCAAVSAAAAAGSGGLAGLTPAQLALGLLHGLSQQLFLVATVESRSRGEPLRFAWHNLVRAITALAAGAAVAVVTGSASTVLTVEAALSIVIAAALLRAQLRAHTVRATALLVLGARRLPRVPWASAAALAAVSSIAFVLINVDRWIAAQSLDAQRFAQYAFAWTVLMVAQSLQVIVGSAVFPMLARRTAAAGRQAAFRLSARVSLLLLSTAALTAFPLWWLLDQAIARWFVSYAEARILLPPFLLVAALRVSDFWSSFLLVAGRENLLLGLQVAVGAACLAAWWSITRVVPVADDLLSVALLAVLLAVFGYFATAAAARASARDPVA